MAVLNKKSDKQKVYDKCGGRCAYCGTPITFDQCYVDHAIPLKRGLDLDLRYERKQVYPQLNTLENYMPSCRSCNSSKGSMDIEEWRQEILNKAERLRNADSLFRLLLRFDLIEIKPVTDFKFYFEKHG